MNQASPTLPGNLIALHQAAARYLAPHTAAQAIKAQRVQTPALVQRVQTPVITPVEPPRLFWCTVEDDGHSIALRWSADEHWLLCATETMIPGSLVLVLVEDDGDDPVFARVFARPHECGELEHRADAVLLESTDAEDGLIERFAVAHDAARWRQPGELPDGPSAELWIQDRDGTLGIAFVAPRGQLLPIAGAADPARLAAWAWLEGEEERA